MSDISPDAVFKVSPKVRFRRVFEEAVVIHQEKAEALVLNDTGVAFLEACDGKLSVGEIKARLVETYEVDPSVLDTDIDQFLTELIEEKIVQRTDPSLTE